MSQVFIEKSRGQVIEAIHRGDAVVVNPAGEIVATAGDPYKYTYFRSSAKPLQALNLLLSGAAEHYGLNSRELAVICSSHYSEDYHIECVRSILAKSGLAESDLACGVAKSIKEEIAYVQTLAGIAASRIKSDCSGKHSGILLTCKYKGYPLQGYLDPEHPVQKEILQLIADICAYPVAQIGIGIDGCNVPVFALPIYNMALGFARFANPETLDPFYREGASKIFTAMNEYPEMVAGTGGFCTELMRVTKGRLMGKIGALGVYCIGLREPQLGVALKIEDGAVGTASLAAIHVLQELNLLSDKEYRELQHFHQPDNLNDDKYKVGEIRAVFTLEQKGF